MESKGFCAGGVVEVEVDEDVEGVDAECSPLVARATGENFDVRVNDDGLALRLATAEGELRRGEGATAPREGSKEDDENDICFDRSNQTFFVAGRWARNPRSIDLILMQMRAADESL